MPIKSLSQSSLTNFQKYSNMLAGNAAFSPSAYDLLETQVLSSSASSVTFTGLGSYSDYKHLQIRYTARTDRALAGGDHLLVQINGDTGSNYAYHWLRATGSSVFSNASANTTQIEVYKGAMFNNATSGVFASGIIDLLDFASTSKNTTLRALSGHHDSGETFLGMTSGLWNNTSAVTSISMFLSSNLIAGCRFSLYGIKGA